MKEKWQNILVEKDTPLEQAMELIAEKIEPNTNEVD